jgi:hypothetical protein
VFREACGRRNVMGTHTWEVLKTLRHYGLRLDSVSVPQNPRPTLAKWLRENKARRTEGRVYLLAAGHHWVVVSGRRAVCGKTKKIVSVVDYPHRRAHVAEAYEVLGTLIDKIPEVAFKARQRALKPVRRRESRNPTLLLANRLARRYGIDIERIDDYWDVAPPEGLFNEAEGDGLPDDPYEDDHFGYTPDEVLERVNAYVNAAMNAAVSKPATQPTVSQTAVTKVGSVP